MKKILCSIVLFLFSGLFLNSFAQEIKGGSIVIYLDSTYQPRLDTVVVFWKNQVYYLSDRELRAPVKLDTVYIKTSYTLPDYLNFVGNGTNTQPPFATYTTNMPTQVGQSRGLTFLKFNPTESGFGNSSMNFSMSSTKYHENGVPDNVFNMGINLNHGGGQVDPLMPSTGYQLEQFFQPGGPNTTGLTEAHLFWGTKGQQKRLYSYTCNNDNGEVDHYITASPSYYKHPNNPSFIYAGFSANANGTGASLQLNGSDPYVTLGGGRIQYISGNGQLNFINSGIRVEKYKAPVGYYRPIYGYDSNGDQIVGSPIPLP